ncbi:hypothetical protein CFIMG_000644RA [Ceratocystis fimbriata CBS 114723]|uniref:Uncharacterized protein n=1 Tax=Ceratocystis fimbriata CBS 114723 TaxID=1035309 RepID=A0A2C5XAC3_9PEZI|nr:hypothetical protein CFIMG_000644RA [Ceratocystis fimbriata CBS 114723]
MRPNPTEYGPAVLRSLDESEAEPMNVARVFSSCVKKKHTSRPSCENRAPHVRRSRGRAVRFMTLAARLLASPLVVKSIDMSVELALISVVLSSSSLELDSSGLNLDKSVKLCTFFKKRRLLSWRGFWRPCKYCPGCQRSEPQSTGSPV